jgi:secondary thiamine-phosphate synthase enzyme
MTSCSLQTDKQGMYDITPQVREAIIKSGAGSGLCVVYCPHTTAAITINENADSDVVRDLLFGLDKTFPDRPEFRHSEGNSAAHLKSSCIGASVTLIVENGEPVFGTWQAVYFCEFDGRRHRTFHVKVVQG